MYLKSLELAGFKSFGQKSTLEFTAPITSVVGPNGSGKSNIAEGFRFVLGEQSIKSMRGKKGEDLIFNGADGGGRQNRASVRITFDNKTRFLALEVDEVVVERTVFRDGSNEYQINGSQVRLKDVLELLSSAHIGSTGHHIISQGEADRILNSNPKERKAIIEDALGLKTFQYKKQESEKKLKKTEDNIKEVELSRREIAPHIRFLKRQVEKIEQAMQMRIELGNKYDEYLKRESVYLDIEGKAIKSALSDPLQQKAQLEKKLADAREVLEKTKKEDVKSQEFIDADNNLREVRSKKDDLVREIGRVEGEILSLQTIFENEKKKLESESHKMIKLSSVSSVYNQIEKIIDNAVSNNDINEVKVSLKQVRVVLGDFVESQKDDTDTSHLDDFVTQIEKKIVEKKEKEAEITKIIEEEQRLVSALDSIKQEIENEKDSNRDAEKAVFQIMAELNHLETILSELNSRKRIWERDTESFESEVREGIVLIGQKISGFHDYQVKDSSDAVLSHSEIAGENREEQVARQRAIEKLKIRLEDAGAGNGEEILKEYTDVTERDQFLISELEDLESAKAKLAELIADLEARIDREFKEGVSKINKEFSNYFGVMFGGGQAGLSVVRQEKRKKKSDEDIDIPTDDEEGDLDEGVEISVSLPRKKIKSLMMLSGGERALTSIALLFAMSSVNPPPFIILDETDAALDEANSRKYGDMIENLSKYSQLILITHNRETMSRAGVLYGITMTSSGISKLLSIAFDEAVKVAK